MKKVFWILVALVIIFINNTKEVKAEHAEIESLLHSMFKERSNAMITKEYEAIKHHYLSNHKSSRSALEHERDRSTYIHTWGSKRNLSFIDAESKIQIVHIKRIGTKAKVFLKQSQLITYQHHGIPFNPQKFGIGTRHLLTLEQKDRKWHIVKEWYLDPLEENPNLIPVSKKGVTKEELVVYKQRKKRTRYNREKAVSYAEKYAGAASMSGNKHRYNPKYVDYTYEGGDCTNFTSQVLGDRLEGGGLPMHGSWFYKKGGSVAWIRTDSLYQFLIHSGYGKLITRGTYEEVAKPNKKFPQGALSHLQPGDLIAYELEGNIDHFSIVTARDDQGYVLVNSHTADRYHVPWDLGWDKKTKFYLIHIRD
ncbi:amidase domain-containing protein [Brevibacillus laterosporus]|uniref:amidase domain-containing protein n=1 Tax=Brevibacillus laterosporus TaxID=1465 RepID=UPI001EF394AA|nr:amidase domain-containing protein [Brevibacillus laterosporus]MCG7317002.1 amidase domain-containing protein [Brevibacillus laterosporus]